MSKTILYLPDPLPLKSCLTQSDYGRTMAVQWPYNGRTMAVQWPYNGRT
jgi:hypothetical protein